MSDKLKQTVRDVIELIIMGCVIYFMRGGHDNLMFLIGVSLFLRQGKIMLALKKEKL